MRAEEMTVGIEICNLENLRIFNGYEVPRKEVKSSNPSSPEDSTSVKDGDQRSKAKGQHSPRQRCGRPSNPVPRHKRDSHIRAEYKRRDKIQKGFATLASLVPELSDVASSKESKSSVLFKTAEYCRGLKENCGQNQNEAAALRRELESLGSEIQFKSKLQEKLPDHGLKDTPEPVQDLDTLYDNYVKQETNKNWKFWIFSFFMRPLFKSYRSVSSGKMNQVEFAQATNEWVTETLSLSNLRKGFLDTFRKFSTQTSILTDPDKLKEEAYVAVGKLGKDQNSFVKPCPPSPNQEVPSLSTSPVQRFSPVASSFATASLVPDLNRLSPGLLLPTVVKAKEPMSPPATTEVPRSSRSRPSTPPSAVAKQRRRSRSRSEMNRTKIEEPSQPMNTSQDDIEEGSGAKILRRMLTEARMEEPDGVRYLISSTDNSPPLTNPFDLDNLVCLSSAGNPVKAAESWPHVNPTTVSDLTVGSIPTSVFTTAYSSPPSSSTFLPIDSHMSISNGQVMQYGQSPDHNESQSCLMDVVMDATICQASESYDLDNLSIYTTAQPTVIASHSLFSACQNSFSTNTDQSKPLKQELYHHEEDSLTGMVNSAIDLMDVGSLLTFLDHDPASVTTTQTQRIPSL